MEARRKNKAEIFEEFDIVLMIKSREEAQALYAVFNRSTNRDLVGWDDANCILPVIGKEYYVDSGIIANDISAEEFYR